MCQYQDPFLAHVGQRRLEPEHGSAGAKVENATSAGVPAFRIVQGHHDWSSISMRWKRFMRPSCTKLRPAFVHWSERGTK